jgi:predicted DNA-binding protein
MAHLSIRLPDTLLADLDAWSGDRSKADIIREALELYRKDQLEKQKKARLSQARSVRW